MPIYAPRSIGEHANVGGSLSEPESEAVLQVEPSDFAYRTGPLGGTAAETLTQSMAASAADAAVSMAWDIDERCGVASSGVRGQSSLPKWPPPYLSEANLAAKKGWHLLNEYIYGAWGIAVAARETVHIMGWANGDVRNFSIDSHLSASGEGAILSGVFAIIEAVGTAHLAWKERNKKSEIDKALTEHEAGSNRFTAGNPKIASMLEDRHALSTLLQTWPCDEAGIPHSVWRGANSSSPLVLEHTRDNLKRVETALQELALALTEDFEHYVVYEQAANQLAESNDNIRSIGIAVARDCVIQLGGTGCSTADAASKFGAHGVDIAANGVASGAFGIAMGALHFGAGAVGWYQAERRLEDLDAVRRQGSALRSEDGRELLVQKAAQSHVGWLLEQAAKTQSEGVRHMHVETAAAAASPAAAEDAAMAKELVKILAHHQDKAFDAIEAAELKKQSRSRTRMVYGTISVIMGILFIVTGTVATGGLLPLVLTAVSFTLGAYWLISGYRRSDKDRSSASLAASADQRAMEEAQRILETNRKPTLAEMQANRFVAINYMLMALLDGDRPITRCALTDALVSMGMDANLLEALRLRSTVRLDDVYAQDKADILEKLRCFASQAQTDVLKSAIAGMVLRSDEAMLRPLRQVFQDFIEGKTSMREQYKRRTGAFSFMRGKIGAAAHEKRERFGAFLHGRFGYGKPPAPNPMAPSGEVVQHAIAPVIVDEGLAPVTQPVVGLPPPIPAVAT